MSLDIPLHSANVNISLAQVVFDTVVTYYELTFENHGYIQKKEAAEKRKDAAMPIKAGMIFEMFPFCILYNVRKCFIFNKPSFLKTQ